MTEDQIRLFHNNEAEIHLLKIKIKSLERESQDMRSKNMDSCDHRLPDGKIAGPEFGGSYCGFHCEVCGSSVSYEKMGY